MKSSGEKGSKQKSNMSGFALEISTKEPPKSFLDS